VRNVVIALALAGCTSSTKLPATHPAQPTAPTGRLAGAPPALRPGVVVYKDVPKTPAAPVDHSHHHHK
jgi:hypothetical protein